MTQKARSRGAALLVAALALTTMTTDMARPDTYAGETWTETRTETYDTGDIGPMFGMWGCNPMGRNGGLGTICFGPAVGDTFRVRIEDDSGREVGGSVEVQTGGGWASVSRQPFCGTSGPISSRQGEVIVYLDAPGDTKAAHWYGGPGCKEVGVLGHEIGTLGATRGRVHVTFTGRGEREAA